MTLPYAQRADGAYIIDGGTLAEALEASEANYRLFEADSADSHVRIRMAAYWRGHADALRAVIEGGKFPAPEEAPAWPEEASILRQLGEDVTAIRRNLEAHNG